VKGVCMKPVVRKVMICAIFALFVLLNIAQTSKQTASYVGDSSCVSCHPKQSESFKTNAHNNAYTIIKDTERYAKLKQEGKEGPCLRCHVTGYGENGGFTDEETSPELAKVGCEGCHGPGNEHVAEKSGEKDRKGNSIQQKPDCRKCHLIHSHED